VLFIYLKSQLHKFQNWVIIFSFLTNALSTLISTFHSFYHVVRSLRVSRIYIMWFCVGPRNIFTHGVHANVMDAQFLFLFLTQNNIRCPIYFRFTNFSNWIYVLSLLLFFKFIKFILENNYFRNVRMKIFSKTFIIRMLVDNCCI
jgi:hypothetical protein